MAVSSLCFGAAWCRRGARHRRLVAAGPAFGGGRGSLPRTGCVAGTAASGCRGMCGAWRRHLAVRARPEWRAPLGATRRELNLAHRRTRAPRLLSLPRALCFVRSRRSAMQLPDDFTGSFSRAVHAGSAAARQIASTSSRAPKVGTAADAPAAALVRDQSGESVERDQTSTLASRCETMTMASRDGICL